MLIDKKILVTNVCHFVGASVADVLKSYGGIVTCHDKSFENYNSRENFLSVNPGMRISTTADISDSIADIIDVFGQLDILVLNDFYKAIRAPVESASEDDFRKTIEALIISPFRAIKSAVSHMKKRGKGKIIFVTSAVSAHGLSNYSMYSSARGGANALAFSLARELASHNIQVNIIAPNYIENESYFPKDLISDESILSKIVAKVPMGRLGKSEEVSEVIAFLSSDKSNFITGEIINIAGGWP